MKNAFLQLCWIVLISVPRINAAGLADFSRDFKLLPQPQKTEMLSGKGINYTSLQGIQLRGGAQKPVLTGLLQALPFSVTSVKGMLILEIAADIKIPSAEGYMLQIQNGNVHITATGQAGIFYGCQTLVQLLEDARDQNIPIPAVKITDYPELAYRGVHIDIKHHVDAGNYYYQVIDRLAQVKVNAIIFEFEDKLRYQKAPVVAARHAISIEEFAAISRYAHERNIEISPLIQGLGHASFILKHEQYKSLRDNPASDWSFDALNPETYTVQFALYDDAIAATPHGKYLHVGGDEVGGLGMSELAKKSGKKPLELQMYWLNKVCEYAREHNRIPIFWDDMLFKIAGLYSTTGNPKIPEDTVVSLWNANESKLSENIGLFPKDCIYMRWNYESPAILGNKKAIDWYKSHQLKVMAATAAQTRWTMLPRQHSNFTSIKAFTQIATEKKMAGILCTIWEDSSPHFETMWRGIYHSASLSWNYTDLQVAEASATFRHRFYAPALSNEKYEFQDLLEQALGFWDKALIHKGVRNQYTTNIDMINLPDPQNTGAWSITYQEKLTQAKEETARYEVIKERIAKAEQVARRNWYALSLMKQMNELQVYPAKLLLLLASYDKETSVPGKQTALKKVQDFVAGFKQIRNNYETVFFKTRIANPPDYQLDSNGHRHLAAGTVNSDWMHYYEIAINDKINKWVLARL